MFLKKNWVNIPFKLCFEGFNMFQCVASKGFCFMIIIDVTFGKNENKVNSLIVTNVAKPKKPLKHTETISLYVDKC
jgi:hypothetical protein